MKRKQRKMTRHHLIPTSRGGYNRSENIASMLSHKHEALHTLFANLSPHEQLMFLVDLNSSVFSERFKRDLWKVLASDPEFVYKKKVCNIAYLKKSMLYDNSNDRSTTDRENERFD